MEHLEYLEEQMAALMSQNEMLTESIGNLMEKITQFLAMQDPELSSTSDVVPKTNHVKPSPLQEFSSEREMGRAFLNSCKLYL